MQTSEIEKRPPSTSAETDATMSASRRKRHYRLAVCTIFWCFFAFGINDGSLGPLIPAYQRYYKLPYITVSLIFIFNSVGFVLAAVLNVFLSGRVNFSRLLAFGAIAQIAAYTILSTAPPFPLVCFAHFLLGSGLSLLNAHGNGFMSMLKNPTEMGVAHASYGAGALVSPLISTQFAQLPGRKWAFHYVVVLGLHLVNLCLIIVVYKGREYDVILEEMGVPHDVLSQPSLASLPIQQPDDGPATNEVPQSHPEHSKGKFVTIMKQTPMHIMAFFVFIYVGTEVSLGGWIVTFMIRERGGGPSSGYVSSGFFGGLAVGRIALLQVNRRLGETIAITLYAVIAAALEITVWFVPSLIENAIAVSFVGMVLGPMYPMVMSQAGRIIPRKRLTGSIGWISGFGGTGAAVLPFVTGALANRFGIRALPPLIVALMAVMGGLWLLVPRVPRRVD